MNEAAGHLRQATTADMPAVLQLLYRAHAEVKPMPVSERKVRGFVAGVFQHGLVLVIERDAAIVGTCGLMADSPWWSEEIGLDSVWLYVAPEHRRTPFATMMLRAMRDYATQTNMPIQVGFAASPETPRKVHVMRKLYERTFGAPTGMSFYVAAGGAR